MKTLGWYLRLFLVLVVASLPSAAFAAYPEKPITLVVVFSAGGGNDIIARTAAELMKKFLPEPVVVVNRPGGGGTIGTTEIIQAKPDGYTIGLSTMPALTMQPHRTQLPYGPPGDYTAIAMLGAQPFLLAVKSDAPWKNVKSFVDHARANPGKVRVTHFGIGSITHLAVEDLKREAGIDLTPVPTKGGADAVAAILGGHLEAGILAPVNVMSYVQANKLAVLGTFEEQRNSLLPQAPTFRELGLDILSSTYSVIIAPKGLPADVEQKLRDAFQALTRDATFVKTVQAQGFAPVYDDRLELNKRLQTDYQRNEKLLRRLGLKHK